MRDRGYALSLFHCLPINQDFVKIHDTFVKSKGVQKCVFLTTKTVLPGMIEAKKGAIVNVASVVGLKGVAFMSAYGAPKAGLIYFSRASAVEAAPNVRVNCVIPGAVLTPATERAIPVKEMMDETIKTIPMKRIAKPIEIAHPIVFLLGPEASFITGASLVVDGGKTGDLNAGN